MMPSGGGFWGGGGIGGGSLGGAAVGAKGGGSFAGIPPELREGVDKIAALEPALPPLDVTFSQRPPTESRLTIARLLRPQARAVAFVLAVLAIETLCLQAGPALIQIGLDRGVARHHRGVLIAAASASIAAVVVTCIAGALRIRGSGRIAARASFDLRMRVFGQLQRLSLDDYARQPSGVLFSRVMSDVEAVQTVLSDGLVQFVVQGLSLVLIAGILFTYDAGLAALTLVVVIPALLGLSFWFRHASDIGFVRVRDALTNVLADLSENLQGMRIVTAFNRQRENRRRHRDIVGNYRTANEYTARIAGFYGPSSEMIGLVGQGFVLVVGGRMVQHGSLSVGELTAFILYIGAFFQPIQQLVTTYTSYQSGRAAVGKLREIIDTVPSVAEHDDAVELTGLRGEIAFEHVDFAYANGAPVLRDVDLRIPAGTTVALVGPTGAGKSTFAKLCTRFYDPVAGRILLDGQDLRSLTLSSLRRQVGVVPQEPFLFAGTIRDNVCFARPDADDFEAVEALDAVGLGPWLQKLPDGLDTPVHERGVSLSAGERQLLALARMFVARPAMVVLDEATSNLDLLSERRIEAALDLLLQGRTALIIAHRLSTAQRADLVVVVDGGRVVEVGPHDDLVARGGRYAQMFAAWTSHAIASA